MEQKVQKPGSCCCSASQHKPTPGKSCVAPVCFKRLLFPTFRVPTCNDAAGYGWAAEGRLNRVAVLMVVVAVSRLLASIAVISVDGGFVAMA